MQGLSLVAASGGHSSSRCAGLSLSRPLLLQSTGSRRAGSVVVAHGLSCSVACGIFLDQGSKPYPLHWQADSQPLRHQGSPCQLFLRPLWTSHFPLFLLRFLDCLSCVPNAIHCLNTATKASNCLSLFLTNTSTPTHTRKRLYALSERSQVKHSQLYRWCFPGHHLTGQIMIIL